MIVSSSSCQKRNNKKNILLLLLWGGGSLFSSKFSSSSCQKKKNLKKNLLLLLWGGFFIFNYIFFFFLSKKTKISMKIKYSPLRERGEEYFLFFFTGKRKYHWKKRTPFREGEEEYYFYFPFLFDRKKKTFIIEIKDPPEEKENKNIFFVFPSILTGKSRKFRWK